MRVACCQMRCETGDLGGNLGRAVEAVRQAIAAEAELIVLPEAWASGFAMDELPACTEAAPGALEAMIDATKGWDGTLVAGSLFTRSGSEVFNHATVLRGGQPIATYRKMHLFAGLGEDTTLTPGSALASFETPIGMAGLALCYDLRFPELFRRLQRRGAAMLVVPAQWPGPRIEHWQLLARARAVENLCFLIGVNVASLPTIDRFHGHSLIVSPWGEVLWEAGEGEELGSVDLRAETIAEAREKLPALDDIRPDLLGP
jgi:omega-amidase